MFFAHAFLRHSIHLATLNDIKNNLAMISRLTMSAICRGNWVMGFTAISWSMWEENVLQSVFVELFVILKIFTSRKLTNCMSHRRSSPRNMLNIFTKMAFKRNLVELIEVCTHQARISRNTESIRACEIEFKKNFFHLRHEIKSSERKTKFNRTYSCAWENNPFPSSSSSM